MDKDHYVTADAVNAAATAAFNTVFALAGRAGGRRCRPEGTMDNIHDVIGWERCASLRCLRHLDADHVVLLTTAHMRRFCSVECIATGQQAWNEAIYKASERATWGTDSFRQELASVVAEALNGREVG